MKKLLILSCTLIAFVSSVFSANITVTGTNNANGEYATLGAAISAIGTSQTGNNIIIEINGSTTEPATIEIGAGTWSSLKIFPTSSNLSISGSLNAPLIHFNGADNVVIDGRISTIGGNKDLTISNTSISATASTSTFKFSNDASNNTIKYCTIKGASAAEAIILFSTATNVGNNANTITENDITSTTNSNRPVACIYSQGSATPYQNSNCSITNNNFYNFFNPTTNSYGILINTNNVSWTISGNSFYETSTVVPNSSGSLYAIHVYNRDNNHIVSNNYIGGTAPHCGGNAWTKTNANNNTFYGISISAIANTSINIQGNTIANINWANASNSNFFGLYCFDGNYNIGTQTANTIGTAVGNGSITLTNGTTYGIYINNNGNAVVQSNIIGGITTTCTTPTNASNFVGISCQSAGISSITNNTIGSSNSETVNSIYTSSPATTSTQTLYGISSTGAGNLTISGNTISKLTNATSNPTTSTNGLINGIAVTAGTNIITNNTINDLTIANANYSTDHKMSVSGIILSISASNPQTITGNIIHNLSNTYSGFSGCLSGITFNGSTTTNTVSTNFIYNLSANNTNSAYAYGIKILRGGATYSNNIISIGTSIPITLYGIYETGSTGTNNIYFNTIHITGNPTTGSRSSYAFYSNLNSNIRDIRNNIFSNTRSNNGASGNHYATYLAYSSGTGLTIDYNDYFASGLGGFIGNYNGNNFSTIASWSTELGQDSHSIYADPLFTNLGGLTATDYRPAVLLAGIDKTGITTDYTGKERIATPTIGALEVTCPIGAAGPISGQNYISFGSSGVVYSIEPIANTTHYIWSYSGTGVTINGTGNSITIDFSNNATSGTLVVKGANSCGEGRASSLEISGNKTLILTDIMLQGLYTGGGTLKQANNNLGPAFPMGIADHITIQLHSATNYYTLYSADIPLSTSGTAIIENIPNLYSDSYYITIKHRNSIETTTTIPVSFAANTIIQSFGTPDKVLGGNLLLLEDLHYAIYSGDVNLDNIVDGGDFSTTDNLATAFGVGYLPEDVNGDGLIDGSDFSIIDNNATTFVSAVTP